MRYLAIFCLVLMSLVIATVYRVNADFDPEILRENVVVSHDDIPAHVAQALIAAEDPLFSQRSLLRSPITSQLSRFTFPSRRRISTKERVKRLVAVAWSYDRAEVLTLYLNTAYFGRGVYGIDAASNAYFGRSAPELDVGEAAFLVMLLKAPTALEAAEPLEQLNRYRHVLDNMRGLGLLGSDQYDALVQAGLPDVLPR